MSVYSCSLKPRLLRPWHELTSVSIFLRDYAMKSDLKIKWVRPEKLPVYRAAKSGDLTPYEAVDLKQPQFSYRNSTELATANETVKKLFSLEYAPRKKTTQIYLVQMLEKVKRHPYDVGSEEVRIAKYTGVIRIFQELMEQYPRNKVMKVRLIELIDKRKKHLNYMRTWDYRKFEWLLEALDIVHKPHPVRHVAVTRKDSLRKLTTKYCDGIKEERLQQYRDLLKSQQPIFLQEKIHALEFIRDEQKACNAEVTVTDEQIDEVRKRLQDLLNEQKVEGDKED